MDNLRWSEKFIKKVFILYSTDCVKQKHANLSLILVFHDQRSADPAMNIGK